jgi:hypothetical protein
LLIENKSFWFVKKFELLESDISTHGVELFIETLDIHADILLNGQFVAHHSSAMYPFSKNVKRFLKAGENTLVIRQLRQVYFYIKALDYEKIFNNMLIVVIFDFLYKGRKRS